MVLAHPRRTPHVRFAASALLALALPLAAQALELSDVALEGELRFLSERPDPGAYHYASQVEISDESLSSGVVRLSTCHHQLDPNAKIIIAFNPQRVQQIEMASTQGVERAQVQGHRVELTQVQRGGSACINLTSKVLERVNEHTWRLHAGPLMRRYLDGYLPMQARLAFHWPDGLLRLQRTEPAGQPGVTVQSHSRGAQLDLVFAGRMTATLDLVRGTP
jgi:hypothetical protein